MGSSRAVTSAEEGAQAPRRPTAVQAPEPITGERFPRRGRLAPGTELRACWEQGQRLRTLHLDLAWRANRAGYPRIGIIVPRLHHTAVARNRLRRRVREVLRRDIRTTLLPGDLVVRAKPAAYSAPFAVLRAELTDAVARLLRP